MNIVNHRSLCPGLLPVYVIKELFVIYLLKNNNNDKFQPRQHLRSLEAYSNVAIGWDLGAMSLGKEFFPVVDSILVQLLHGHFFIDEDSTPFPLYH